MKQTRLAVTFIVLGSCFLSSFSLSSCAVPYSDHLKGVTFGLKEPSTKTGSTDPIQSKNSGREEQSKQPAYNHTDNSLVGSSASNKQSDPINASLSNSFKYIDDNNLAQIDISGLPSFPGHNKALGAIYLIRPTSKDSREILVSIDQSGVVAAWNFSQKPPQAFKIFELRPGFTSLAFHRGQLRLAVAYPGLVEIYSLQTRALEFSLNRIKGRVAGMDFETQGQGLVLGGVDGVVYRWRFEHERAAETILEKEKGLERYLGHSSVVNIIKCHPFGRTFFSADWYGGISAWLNYEGDRLAGEYDSNVFSGREFSESVTRTRGARTATTIIEQSVMTKDGEFLINGTEDGMLELWQVRGFKAVASIQSHKGIIYSLDVSSDGTNVITIGRDGFLRVWQIDEKPGPVVDNKVYTFVKMKEISLNGFRQVIFENDNSALLAGLDGKIIRFNLVPDQKL